MVVCKTREYFNILLINYEYNEIGNNYSFRNCLFLCI